MTAAKRCLVWFGKYKKCRRQVFIFSGKAAKSDKRLLCVAKIELSNRNESNANMMKKSQFHFHSNTRGNECAVFAL